MALIRTASSSPPTETTLTVLVDGLENPSTEYYQITLYAQRENGMTIGTRNMLGLSGSGGNSTSGYRTGTTTYTGLDSGTTYRFFALAKHYSYSTEVRIPASGYYYFSTVEPVENTGIPSIDIVSIDGLNIFCRVHTGDYTGNVYIDYDWISGSSNQNVNVGSNDSQTFSFTVPNYGTYYEIRAGAYAPDNSQMAFSNWVGFYSGQAVGSITGLSATNSTSNSISISWNDALYAATYRIQYKLSSSSSWTTSTSSTTNTWWTFTGLQTATSYDIRVRGEDGSNYGSYTTISAQTLGNNPTVFNWTYPKTSGGAYNLTAQEWNSLCSKVNQWREYKLGAGYAYSFSTAYTGDIFYATMFNQVRTAISPLNPTVSLPAARSKGDVVTATALNGLKDSLNSIS